MGCTTGLLGVDAAGGGAKVRKIHNLKTQRLGGRGTGAVLGSSCNELTSGSGSSARSRSTSSSLAVSPASAPTTSSSALRQLVYRVRSGWRGQVAWCAGGSGNRRPKFGYDPDSYSQNFDDGFFHDYD